MLRIVLALLLAAACRAAQPLPVIFDTDMGNDVDDALALSLLHELESRGEIRLLAVTITKDNPWAAAYVDAVNTFYGRPDIPIGVVRRGKTADDGKFVRQVASRRGPGGKPLYPYDIDPKRAADAVSLLRTTLSGQPDNSVVIIQVGFSTNLARLLAEREGRDLAARKVKLLSAMAGAFPKGQPEYNVATDIPSAKKVMEEWPTPVVLSGFEIGEAITYPAESILRDYGYVANHPVAEAYRLYEKMPHDRPTWDLTSVLYAVFPERGYFDLSPQGLVRVDSKGTTTHSLSPNGRVRYLTVNAQQAARVREALVWLASAPPRRP